MKAVVVMRSSSTRVVCMSGGGGRVGGRDHVSTLYICWDNALKP